MMSVDDRSRVRSALSRLATVGAPLDSFIHLVLAIFEEMSSDYEALARQSPGHRFLRKYEHQIATVVEAVDWYAKFGFEGAEIACYILVASCHDWGRFIEILRGKSLVRPGLRHGLLSAEALRASTVFRRIQVLFGRDFADRVCDALIAHAEDTVDLPYDCLAWRVAYALRDRDKLAIVRDEEAYFTAPGIAQQLLTHNLAGMIKAHNQQPHKVLDTVTEFVAHFLPGRRTLMDGFFGFGQDLQEEVLRLLSAEIPNDLIDNFCDGRQIDIRRVADGWGAHMLWHLSLAHDVQLPLCFREFVGDPLFDRRAQFVCGMVPEIEAERIMVTIRELKIKAGI